MFVTFEAKLTFFYLKIRKLTWTTSKRELSLDNFRWEYNKKKAKQNNLGTPVKNKSISFWTTVKSFGQREPIGKFSFTRVIFRFPFVSTQRYWLVSCLWLLFRFTAFASASSLKKKFPSKVNWQKPAIIVMFICALFLRVSHGTF